MNPITSNPTEIAGHFVGFVERQLQVRLSYDGDGVRWLDGFITRQHERTDAGDHTGLVVPLGAFLGECIIRTFDGSWVVAEDGNWCVQFDNGNAAFPLARVEKQLSEGASESVLSFFEIVGAVFRLPSQLNEPTED